MKFNHLICFLVFCVPVTGYSQQTTVYNDANEAYKKGVEVYAHGLLGEAQGGCMNVSRQPTPANEPDSEWLRKRAELYYAKAAVQLDSPEGEKLVMDFARKYD